MPPGFLEYSVLIALVAVSTIFVVMLIGDRTQRLLSLAPPSAASSAVASNRSTAAATMAPIYGLGIWSGHGIFVLASDAASAQARGFVLTNVGVGPLAVGTPTVSGQDAS
jgi:NO-binding membrane sensor protein with MHYT domain